MTKGAYTVEKVTFFRYEGNEFSSIEAVIDYLFREAMAQMIGDYFPLDPPAILGKVSDLLLENHQFVHERYLEIADKVYAQFREASEIVD